MRIETALKYRDRAITQLRDMHSSAQMFGTPSATMNERFAEIQARCAKCPEWVMQYVRGYRAALIDQLYRDSLVFGGFVGDKFYSVHRDRADYYEKNGIEPCAYADDGLVTRRGHYWIKSVDAGKPQPFFIS